MSDGDTFPDIYFETRFRGEPIPANVKAFAIITAWPTTGETWPSWVIDQADRELQRDLMKAGALLGRMTGYSPIGDHEEPGWAAQMPLDAACDLGMSYQQTAIYYVDAGTVFLSYCDERRALKEVGPFKGRFTPQLG